MAWDVEVTDEFKAWWNGLAEAERVSVERAVLLLEERGPHLPFPYSSGVTGSRHSAMRELRVQHQGHPYRVLYIFDSRRVALLLLGGDKTGDDPHDCNQDRKQSTQVETTGDEYSQSN